MKPFVHTIVFTVLSCSAFSQASQEGAEKLRNKWTQSNEQWSLQMRSATTSEQRRKLIAERPNLAQHLQEMWLQIGGSLDKEWAIEPAAWFLQATQSINTNNLAAQPQYLKETELIYKAIDSFHLKSQKLNPMCMALATSKSARAIDLLDKIRKNHSNPQIQGVASLAAAISLKSLGDDKDSIKKRLTYLRTAIIQSADVKIGNTTVGQIAQDETYIISNLSKGRVAPDLVGSDVAGRSIKLSDYSGKVVMLVFWNSQMENYDDAMRILTETTNKLKTKPFAIVGVNNDPSEVLRKLASTDSLPFPSFSDADGKLSSLYRVATRPLVYVLDKERKIHYAGSIGSFAELTAEALIAP